MDFYRHCVCFIEHECGVSALYISSILYKYTIKNSEHSICDFVYCIWDDNYVFRTIKFSAIHMEACYEHVRTMVLVTS